MRTVAIIQARVGSTRLPGKVLARAAGKPLLQHMVERLGRCERLDDVVVATPREDDQSIPVLCDRIGARYIRYDGDPEDVLSRVLATAHSPSVRAELIVELTADCPLVDPAIVDRAVEFYKNCSGVVYLDFVSTSQDSFLEAHLPEAYPRGMDVRVFSRSVLEEVDRLTDDPEDREHVSLFIWENRGRRFHCHDLRAPVELAKRIRRHGIERLTVDEAEDLELVQEIFRQFAPRNDFSLEEVVDFLAKRPDLVALNARVLQKKV